MTEALMGLMQNWPLTVDKVITHAARIHGAREVVTRRIDGQIHRTTYAALHDRARQVSAALAGMGIEPGDRVATLAWNGERHMEFWYGAMGIGAVLHTLNPRLHPDQIAWIARDAGSRVLVLDTSFVDLIEPLRERLPFEHYVVIADCSPLPEAPWAVAYEDWLAGAGEPPAWGRFDENAACGLCYTSGTTGNPKGVLYSHRSNVLHAMIATSAGGLAIGPDEVVMPIVPMFHANAWGLAFACPMAGAKMIMPGAQLDGASVYELLDRERVTFSAGVPTVWLGLLQHLRDNGLALNHLRRMVVGGAALPEAILTAFEDDYGVEVIHAWGMTETSPLGTIGGVPAGMGELSPAERTRIKLRQGRPPFGVELKLADEHGAELPWDGKTSGRLLVRGFAVAGGYFNAGDTGLLDPQGFFDTGDVATIDHHANMAITDRAKDVIKSGGEWISSIEIENLACGHPKSALAAVIGVPHPKWDERPLLLVKLKPGETATREEYLAFLDGKIAKWWMPDDVVFVDDIPLGATGKIDKKLIRQTFADYVLPTVKAAE